MQNVDAKVILQWASDTAYFFGYHAIVKDSSHFSFNVPTDTHYPAQPLTSIVLKLFIHVINFFA